MGRIHTWWCVQDSGEVATDLALNIDGCDHQLEIFRVHAANKVLAATEARRGPDAAAPESLWPPETALPA